MTTKLNFGVFIIDLSFHTNVWRLPSFRIISLKYLAYFTYEKVVESHQNMLLKALTMHASCLFFKPEAVSKHSVSLWIGYSDYIKFTYIHKLNNTVKDNTQGMHAVLQWLLLMLILQIRQ